MATYGDFVAIFGYKSNIFSHLDGHNWLKRHLLIENYPFLVFMHKIMSTFMIVIIFLKKKTFEKNFNFRGIRTWIAQGIADMLDLREILP